MENICKESTALNGAEQECVKETKLIQNQHIPKNHLNNLTKTIRNNGHQNQGHRGAMDDSNNFVIKALVVWILICVPGNIFAMTIFWKHGVKLEPHDHQMDHPLNLSVKAYSALENDTQQPEEPTDERITGMENIVQAVSYI